MSTVGEESGVATSAAPPTDRSQPVLATTGVTLRYGDLTAVDSVDLVVQPGARHALIGPNGAGKSSLFAVLAGSTRATGGVVTFKGEDVTGENDVRRARRGLVRTYQHANLFLGLSVLDNVRVAVERSQGRPLRPWPSRRHGRRLDEQAMEHLRSVGLTDRSHALVASLSHGERRQLEVGVVLACRPELVLFDEPTAGMSAAETQRFAELVESLPSSMATIIVEHDLDVVFRLAERISVLAAGRLIAEGTPAEVRANDDVRAVYLGESHQEEPLFHDWRRKP